LTIVDLAGSERISKSGSNGIRLEEAKKINISVSSLGNCINALAQNQSMQHVPFRDSKLTRILTECLGYLLIFIFSGNSKTAICACVSPYLVNYDETIITLQFASRAIKIKIHAKKNEKIEMKKIKDTIDELKKIKDYDLILQENNRIEKDTIDLKNTLTNCKNELRNILKKTKNDEDDPGKNNYSKILNKN